MKMISGFWEKYLIECFSGVVGSGKMGVAQLV
jgi:hypothetical protein